MLHAVTCLKGAFIVFIFLTEPGSMAFMSLKTREKILNVVFFVILGASKLV